MSRADEMITQLEAEIVKRDARIAELEANYDEACDDAMGVARELAALKARQKESE